MRCETVLGHICFCNALGGKMALYTLMAVDNAMNNDETADKNPADKRPFAFRP